jgi:ribosomal protein S18 acetylase RimI-like enzyme
MGPAAGTMRRMTTRDGPTVRDATPHDRAAIDAFLHAHNADVVARRGELVDARLHPQLVAIAGGELAGVLTYIPDAGSVEALTVHAADRWQGAGTALIDALRSRAAAAGWRRIWLITTNDNVDALRFYQRRGFRLVRVLPGAVDASRTRLKPSIPKTGAYGIPLRDELELELLVDTEDAP